MSEIWSGPSTDDVLGANLGETILTNVHSQDKCAGRACVLHSPSAHHMVTWPTLFRADLGIMERICPHGIGHPDPDDLAFHVSLGHDWLGVHGCDGCCVPPESKESDGDDKR
jgi:hypothetical protein